MRFAFPKSIFAAVKFNDYRKATTFKNVSKVFPVTHMNVQKVSVLGHTFAHIIAFSILVIKIAYCKFTRKQRSVITVFCCRL